jgi:GNAT superfamily N-acetyltransferase
LEIVTVTSQSEPRLIDAVKRFLTDEFPGPTASRLETPWGDETYAIVAAMDGETCVGTTSYTISKRGQGCFSQVKTAPEKRGQGISKQVIQVVIDQLNHSHARAIYLAVWVDWIERLYRGFGFERIGTAGPRVAMKLTLNPGGEDNVLFRAGQQTRFRDLKQDDQGDLSSLFNGCRDHVVKNAALDNFLGAHFEPEFYTLLQRREQNERLKTLVLDGEETILGFGSVTPRPHYLQSHRAMVDVLVHPNYASMAGEVLSRLESMTDCERLNAYAGPDESHRIHLLTSMGYKPVREWPACLNVNARDISLLEYEKQRQHR